MPARLDVPDEVRKAFCGPPQNEESSTNIVLAEKIENPVGILNNAALHRVPIASSQILYDGLGVEIVFDVDREPIPNVHFEISPPSLDPNKQRRSGPRTTTTTALFCAPSKKYGLGGVEKDQKIKSWRHILNVKEVVPKLFLGILDRASVFVAYLGPPGNSRPNGMPQVIVGNFSSEPVHEFRPFWARANKAHIALEHVPELWNLVKS